MSIIKFPGKGDREKRLNGSGPGGFKPSKPPREPILHLPPGVKMLAGALVAIHVILWFVPMGWHAMAIQLGAFMPARMMSGDPLALITPITHMFLHGSWTHLAMNTFSLLAFGSALERGFGTKNMLLVFFGCGIAGAVLCFFLAEPQSTIIGASGGTSGLFSGALLMMMRHGWQTPQGLKIFIAIWLVYILFIERGMSGIAWQAHLGGFLAGLALVEALCRAPRQR